MCIQLAVGDPEFIDAAWAIAWEQASTPTRPDI
jgi:hypothetical protein